MAFEFFSIEKLTHSLFNGRDISTCQGYKLYFSTPQASFRNIFLYSEYICREELWIWQPGSERNSLNFHWISFKLAPEKLLNWFWTLSPKMFVRASGTIIAITTGISIAKEDSSVVQWWERGGGLLSLVSTCGEIGPPWPFDTLVTGMGTVRDLLLSNLCSFVFLWRLLYAKSVG